MKPAVRFYSVPFGHGSCRIGTDSVSVLGRSSSVRAGSVRCLMPVRCGSVDQAGSVRAGSVDQAGSVRAGSVPSLRFSCTFHRVAISRVSLFPWSGPSQGCGYMYKYVAHTNLKDDSPTLTPLGWGLVPCTFHAVTLRARGLREWAGSLVNARGWWAGRRGVGLGD